MFLKTGAKVRARAGCRGNMARQNSKTKILISKKIIFRIAFQISERYPKRLLWRSEIQNGILNIYYSIPDFRMAF